MYYVKDMFTYKGNDKSNLSLVSIGSVLILNKKTNELSIVLKITTSIIIPFYTNKMISSFVVSRHANTRKSPNICLLYSC